MREQHTNENDFWENGESGTYQTGSSKPRKGQSALITGLLMATIFLGGLASALGVMNIRLLTQLLQQQTDEAYLPVDSTQATGNPVQLQGSANGADNAIRMPTLSLQIADENDEQLLTSQQLARQGSACTVVLSAQSGDGESLSETALVLSADGYLLANAAFTDGADDFTVTFADGEEKKAVLVASDVYADLAVLYVEANDLQAARFATSLQSESAIYAMEQGQMQAGRISSENVPVLREETLICTDLHGDSGPVFNEYGHVVGYRCRSLSDENGEGLLLPAKRVMQIVTELAQNGTVSGHPRLGFRVKNMADYCRRFWDISAGVQIASVTDSQSGLGKGLQEGDILMSVNGTTLTEPSQLYGVIAETEEGAELSMQVFRGGLCFEIRLVMENNR